MDKELEDNYEELSERYAELEKALHASIQRVVTLEKRLAEAGLFVEQAPMSFDLNAF